jgi:YesN/AraC family two-component response regulator
MENKKSTLLLVDDEAHIRTLMKTVVKPLEFDSIVEAKNGQEAITVFKECSPTLTLLDINMP